MHLTDHGLEEDRILGAGNALTWRIKDATCPEYDPQHPSRTSEEPGKPDWGWPSPRNRGKELMEGRGTGRRGKQWVHFIPFLLYRGPHVGWRSPSFVGQTSPTCRRESHVIVMFHTHVVVSCSHAFVRVISGRPPARPSLNRRHAQ